MEQIIDLEQIFVKKDNEKIVLINSEIPSLISLTFDGYETLKIDNYFNGLSDKISINLIDGIIRGLTTITRGNACRIGKNVMALFPDGTLYPCSEFIESKFKLSNYLEKIAEIKKNPLLDEFTNLSIEKISKCNKCEYKYYCGGGCRLHSYIKYGSLYMEDNYCSLIKFCYEKILLKIA